MAVREIHWLGEAEERDYAAAGSFLSMIVAPATLASVLADLRRAPAWHWAAKDILRAAGLPPLKPKRSAEAAVALAKIRNGEPISPILLVGGLRPYLVIADGYHRVSAAHRILEDAAVPGRLLWLD